VPALLKSLQERDRRLRDIDAQLKREVIIPERDALRAALELRRGDWRKLLRGEHVQQGRMIVQHLMSLPIRIFNDPVPRWMTTTRPAGMLVGLIEGLASQSTPTWNQIVSFLRDIEKLKAAGLSAA